MGRYLEIIQQCEEYQQGETPSAPPPYRDMYQAITSQIPETFFHVDRWLCDTHPELWRRIRDLDDEILALELHAATAEVFSAKLTELLTLCQKAWQLRKHAGSAVWTE